MFEPQLPQSLLRVLASLTEWFKDQHVSYALIGDGSSRFTLSKSFSRSRSLELIVKCPSIAHPFGCGMLEDISIQFSRGQFYLVTTCGNLPN